MPTKHRCERDHPLLVAYRSAVLMRSMGINGPYLFSEWPRDVSRDEQLTRGIRRLLRHLQDRPNGSDFVLIK